MAVITMDFNSKELKMNTLLSVIVPDSVRSEGKPISERKVLWLLHGLSDDGSSWLRRSMIEVYAEKEGLIVIMPSVGRSMYCDNVLGQNYFSFVAYELPEYLSLIFNLSRKKQDNFIAGLSMGGLGAAKIALSNPEKYSAVGCFSGLLDLEPMIPLITEDMKNEFPFMFSDIDDVKNSAFNPAALLDAEKDNDLKIYVACGLQDDLLGTNYSFKSRADELGIKIKYIFEDGSHNWDFWNKHIKEFINFMLG